jgi:hypothetical protein
LLGKFTSRSHSNTAISVKLSTHSWKEAMFTVLTVTVCVENRS